MMDGHDRQILAVRGSGTMRKSTVGWLVGLGTLAAAGAGLAQSMEAEGAVLKPAPVKVLAPRRG
jgi:hypothetical protein